MSSIYTEALVAKIKALSVDGKAITFAQAEAFAEANGLKPRSVVAKIKSMKMPYEPKPTRVTKTGEAVIHKAELVAAIEAVLGVKAPSLEKATKEDLQAVLAALPAAE